MFFECGGGHARYFFEGAAEMMNAQKANGRRYLGDVHVGMKQQCFCFVYTYISHISHGGAPGDLLELFEKIYAFHVHYAGERLQCDFALEMFVYIADYH